MNIKVLSTLIFILFLVLWQAACSFRLISPILLPAPVDVGKYLILSTMDGTLPYALFITLKRLIVGYSMGLLLGVGLGLILRSSALGKATLGKLALGLQTLPSVCWAPLALLWFGQTETAMYFVVIMGSMWGIALSTESAIHSVPIIYIQAARVMGSTGLHTWRTIIFPAALPQLINGARIGWAFAWRSLMAAEIYVTIVSQCGLGQLLHFGRELHAMDQAIGIMVIIVIVGFFTDKFIFSRRVKA